MGCFMIGYGYDKIAGMGDASVDMGLSGANGVFGHWYDMSLRLVVWNGKSNGAKFEHAAVSKMLLPDV